MSLHAVLGLVVGILGLGGLFTLFVSRFTGRVFACALGAVLTFLSLMAFADEGGDATTQLLSQLAAYSPGQLLHLAFSVLVGALLAPAGQAFIEHLLALMPALPAVVKSVTPSVLGAAGAYLANRLLGITVEQAQFGWASFVGLTHFWNSTNLAAVSLNPNR